MQNISVGLHELVSSIRSTECRVYKTAVYQWITKHSDKSYSSPVGCCWWAVLCGVGHSQAFCKWSGGSQPRGQDVLKGKLGNTLKCEKQQIAIICGVMCWTISCPGLVAWQLAETPELFTVGAGRRILLPLSQASSFPMFSVLSLKLASCWL